MASDYKININSPSIGDEELEKVTECIKSNWISSLGPYVKNFEEQFASYNGVHFGVSTNSGTTALHLALASLDIKSGDEVIMPDFTMIATINAVEYLGAKAVLVDADVKTWNIDITKIEEKITDKTKAIMPVHIYGHPSDMEPILKLAQKYNLKVIEDAAEAHGAEYKGKKAGSIGDVGCFSFYANKIITTGEGGMCITDDKDLNETMSWLRAHAFGRDGKHFWHERLGYGYRLSALQAAVGLGQLSKIDYFVRRRRERAKLYNDLLSDLVPDKIDTPVEMSWAKNVYWMYSIMTKNQKERDGVMEHLEKNGIESRTFFYPIHKQPFYRERYSGERYPNSDYISERGMNLPSGNTTTDDEIHRVVQVIRDYFTS